GSGRSTGGDKPRPAGAREPTLGRDEDLGTAYRVPSTGRSQLAEIDFARRDFLRAAVLGRSTPLVTALSIFFWAARKATAASSPSAVWAFMMAVFRSLSTDLMRIQHTSF